MKIYDIINENINDNPKKNVAEGLGKKIKRGLQGWYKDDVGPNGEKLGDPKELVRRNKSYDDETLQRFAKSIAGEKKTKHSPGELQQRVIDREMRKRGLGEQGVAEGEYDDPRWEPREPDMSRKVDWDIEAERNRPEEAESDMVVYIIDNETNEIVLKFRSTGEYWGDVKHAAKHGYDTDGDRFDIKWKRKKIEETATAGATSAANVGTVVSPHLAIGKDRGNKSYTGSPGKSGTKAPKVPKTVQKKNPDGTAKNALDMSNNIFGGGAVKR